MKIRQPSTYMDMDFIFSVAETWGFVIVIVGFVEAFEVIVGQARIGFDAAGCVLWDGNINTRNTG